MGRMTLREKPIVGGIDQRQQSIGVGRGIGQLQRPIKPRKQCIEVVRDKTRVFEIAQEAEIADQADDQP